MKNIFIILSLLYALIFSAQASAVMLSFGCITDNSLANCAAGEAQTSLDVTDAGSDQVRFKFSNTGAASFFISDIYFDNGENGSTLASIDSLEEMVGVDFRTPIPGMGDLPGGQMVDFDTTMELEANNEPGAANGIDPGEMLGIIFNLVSGQTFNDVINELASGDLRVGIHVQGFQPDGSESFVNAPVPLPAAVWFLGTGLMALLGLSRHKKIP